MDEKVGIDHISTKGQLSGIFVSRSVCLMTTENFDCLGFFSFSFSFESPESIHSIQVSTVGPCWDKWRLSLEFCLLSIVACIEIVR